MHTQMMIASHPKVRGAIDDSLVRRIDLCFDCAQACVACADACIGEDMVAELRQCIRLDLDCADICTVAGTVASRRTGSAQAWDDHASRHEHCRVCAETRRACERACRDAAVALGAMH